MAQVQDVAAYILSRKGPMTAMKLQKLVYYSQAWHLVWDEVPLFEEEIEAWANGPVVPELYRRHRQRLRLAETETLGGDAANLATSERDTIDVILRTYGDKSANWLSELTHREAPWKKAREREGLTDGDRGSAPIYPSEMFEYYDGLTSTTAQDI